MKPALFIFSLLLSTHAFADNAACARFQGFNGATAKWKAELVAQSRCRDLTGQESGLSIRGTCIINAEAYNLRAKDAGREVTLCLNFPPIGSTRIFGAFIIGILND